MLAEKRRSKIFEIVNNQSSVTIEELLETFEVSRMTLWRDLQYLEKKGLIRRVHGGAMKIDKLNEKEEEFQKRRQNNYKQKHEIAKFAANYYINDSDIIFLDGGSTVIEIIPYLKKKGITLLTNGLYTLFSASKFISHINVIGTGGVLRKSSYTFVGAKAEEFFKDYKVNTAFISGTGFTIEDGVMDPDPLEMQVKKIMCNNAEKIVVLMDSSKFKKRSLLGLITIDQIDVLITDNRVSQDFLEVLKSKKLDVKIVDV